MKVNLRTSILLAVALYHSTVSTTPVGKCPEVFDPDQLAFLPHNTDCTKFYMCSQSGPAEKSCPPGLHWNAEANVCDWPDLAGCDPGSVGSSSTSTGGTSTSAVPDTSSAPVTTSSPPDVSSTSSSVESTTYPPTESTSPAPTSTNPPTTSSAPSSPVAPAEKCPEVFDPHTAVLLPHVDCSKFYVCTADGPVEMDCPAGLHWSPYSNVCEWPEVAGCVPGASTTEAVRLDSVGQCPELYDPENEVFLPHASDCSKYYLCTWGGVAVVQNCPAGLHWNKNTDQCDWPGQAGCVQVNRDPHFRKFSQPRW